MKKWMMYVLIGVCAAGAAVAEDNAPWWKKPFIKSAEGETLTVPPPAEVPPPSAVVSPEIKPEIKRPQLTPEQKEKIKARAAQQREGAGERPMQPNQQFEKIKAQHETLMKLGEVARNETDPAKKEVLIAELRAKLTEIADKVQADAKKRLEQATKEMANLQKRIGDYDKNKEARIEGQLKRILAGEPLKAPGGKKTAKPGEGSQNKKGPKAPPAQAK